MASAGSKKNARGTGAAPATGVGKKSFTEDDGRTEVGMFRAEGLDPDIIASTLAGLGSSFDPSSPLDFSALDSRPAAGGTEPVELSRALEPSIVAPLPRSPSEPPTRLDPAPAAAFTAPGAPPVAKVATPAVVPVAAPIAVQALPPAATPSVVPVAKESKPSRATEATGQAAEKPAKGAAKPAADGSRTKVSSENAARWAGRFKSMSLPDVSTNLLKLSPEFIAAIADVTPKPKRSKVPYVILGGILLIVGVLALDRSTRTFLLERLTSRPAPIAEPSPPAAASVDVAASKVVRPADPSRGVSP